MLAKNYLALLRDGLDINKIRSKNGTTLRELMSENFAI